MRKDKYSRKGLTLIELIISIALIGVIVIGFMPLFIMATKVNNISETTLNSTYIGKDTMELIYNLSRTVPYESLEDELIREGYIKDASKNTFEREYSDKKYSKIIFSEEGNLIRVVVKIYEDNIVNKLEAQYESVYPWLGRDS